MINVKANELKYLALLVDIVTNDLFNNDLNSVITVSCIKHGIVFTDTSNSLDIYVTMGDNTVTVEYDSNKFIFDNPSWIEVIADHIDAIVIENYNKHRVSGIPYRIDMNDIK